MITSAGAKHPTVPEGGRLATKISNFKCHMAEERALCVLSSYTKAKVQKDLGKLLGLGFSLGKLSCLTWGFASSPHLPQSVKLQQTLTAHWNEWQWVLRGMWDSVLCWKVESTS